MGRPEVERPFVGVVPIIAPVRGGEEGLGSSDGCGRREMPSRIPRKVGGWGQSHPPR